MININSIHVEPILIVMEVNPCKLTSSNNFIVLFCVWYQLQDKLNKWLLTAATAHYIGVSLINCDLISFVIHIVLCAFSFGKTCLYFKNLIATNISFCVGCEPNRLYGKPVNQNNDKVIDNHRKLSSIITDHSSCM